MRPGGGPMEAILMGEDGEKNGYDGMKVLIDMLMEE